MDIKGTCTLSHEALALARKDSNRPCSNIVLFVIGNRLIKLDVDRPIANVIAQLAQSGLGTFWYRSRLRALSTLKNRELNPTSPTNI